jgi:putative hydrolase of the HAD superfamily
VKASRLRPPCADHARRAIVFDLDETLYRERRFMLSGFAAVAAYVEREIGAPATRVFGALRAGSRQSREDVFQKICDEWDLPSTQVPALLEVYRGHSPRLRLPRETRTVLALLRGSWQIAVLTNGLPAVQRRKIDALGLEPLVDTVVYACEHGTGDGKPHPEPFREVLGRLGASAGRTVFVGDDPWCDVEGARRIGMRTIRIRQGSHRRAPVTPANDADVVVSRLALVPEAAILLMAAPEAHVA